MSYHRRIRRLYLNGCEQLSLNAANGKEQLMPYKEELLVITLHPVACYDADWSKEVSGEILTQTNFLPKFRKFPLLSKLEAAFRTPLW